jgi:zinc protease
MPKIRTIYPYLFLVAIAVLFVAALSGAAEARTSRITFQNGMEVIFKENHSSPMITSIVFVRAGAKYENDFNNGITHFLEHLLFDGTKNRSRLEISEGIKRHGGYINAFTRKDLTAYLVLMPREYIEYGIEIQADQLFNSIFPEEELAKERKVVIEEIQMDNDREANLASYFFNSRSMAGTAYERPVLGYKNVISSIPRQKIIEYWKQYYAPNNMISLVIGDFDTEKMIETYRSVFGIIPPVNMPSPPEISYFPPTGKDTYRMAGNTEMTYISVGIDAPHYTDPDYYAFDLVADYLNSDESSPLATTLIDTEGQPLYQSYSAYLETAEEYSRLIIEIVTDDELKADGIVAGIEQVLENFDEFQPSAEVLEGLMVSKKVEEIFMEEKLHYYGFVIAPRLVTTGWDFMESYLDVIDKVNPTMMVRAADRWLDDLKYIATVFHPRKETPEDKQEKIHTVYRKEVLPNGLTVVVKSNPDSRVFALNVIGKNRSVSEPPGKDGITDFLNRLIKKGTVSRSAEDLTAQLAGIGAKVTLVDNPWIPYDDRYTTRQFSFMKFETIDDFTDQGLELFADMIRHPAIDSMTVEQVRGTITGLIARQSGMTLNRCRDLFYATLFENTAYSRSINGSQATIGAITRKDLVDYHQKFYSPGNMIVTIGTNFEADTMMAMVKNAFGDMPQVNFAPARAQKGPPIVGAVRAHNGMEKEQVYIYLGNILPAAGHPDAPAIKLAVEILSRRLGQILREEQGLAYSVGAGATLDKGFGWYRCTMGTGAGNFDKARKGIIAEIMRLQAEGPTAEELETAKNSLWGSSLMRRLSRINQAYYMGVNEYLGLGYDYEKEYIPRLRALTTTEVQAAAMKYFDTENYVLATVGKI